MRGFSPWLPMAAVNLLLPIGTLMFAKGFFPYKPFLTGLATFDSQDVIAPAPFNKVVFMVVDALRSDFVFGEHSGFKFTQRVISDGSAIPFTAHATSPTITMPRVKAITTGSIPGFLDVILNFAESDTSSSLALQDNWLAQIKTTKEGKLVMYGDDTWLKLFPGMFERSDGTSSFFVSDFTEVDNNVTRHIDSELANDDWGAMVLHYLGLDHIGHKSGPRSAFMLPKQAEMDGIVERIYTAIETQKHLQSTLLVLIGDHGMNEAGNHGGSGEGETSPALVFMSPKLKKIAPRLKSRRQAPTSPRGGDFGFYETVEQSDLVPSLTSLLGLPVPRNSLGVFIPELLWMWDNLEDRVEILMKNARQLQTIFSAAYPELDGTTLPRPCENLASEAKELACEWDKLSEQYLGWQSGTLVLPGDFYRAISQVCIRYQDLLSGVASNYDLRMMTGGILAMLVASVVSVAKLYPLLGDSSLADWSFLAITLSYGGMMFASSYVEEEQNFWYWIACGWLMALFLKHKRNSNGGKVILLTLALLRVVRRWNQTGQKHAGADDIVKTFFSEHPTVLWQLIITTYSDVFVHMLWSSFRRIGQLGGIFALTTTLAAFSFKLSYTAYDARETIPLWLLPMANAIAEAPLVSQARAVFAMVAVGLLYTYFFETTPEPVPPAGLAAAYPFSNFTDIFLLMQTRFVNVPLILIFRSIARFLLYLPTLTASELTVTTLIFQHVSFFALGGANAISSVDLSNAYNGVSGYNVVVVGFLTFVSNWVGPIFWATAAPTLLSRNSPGDDKRWERHLWAMTTFYAAAGVAVMAACMALRTHLFIWTVFSPKYLYTMVWSTGFHVVIGIGWGSVMMWASGRMIV